MENFLISDGLLTPKIVMPFLGLVCEGQSRLVRQGVLAGDSPLLASFTSRVYDAFKDGDYTSSPAWTVASGTWSATTLTGTGVYYSLLHTESGYRHDRVVVDRAL